MSELIIFHGLTAKINIPRNIGTKCHEFCKKILEDTTGEDVESIRSKYIDAPEHINRVILELWLQIVSNMGHTDWSIKRYWSNNLAKEIEAVKSHN